MIDWVQVRRERRTKLIVIPQYDMADYALIRELPDVQVLSMFDLPEHWMVGGVSYNFERSCFLFEILSPEYEKKPLGAESDMVREVKKIIEITRKEVV